MSKYKLASSISGRSKHARAGYYDDYDDYDDYPEEKSGPGFLSTVIPTVAGAALGYSVANPILERYKPFNAFMQKNPGHTGAIPASVTSAMSDSMKNSFSNFIPKTLGNITGSLFGGADGSTRTQNLMGLATNPVLLGGLAGYALWNHLPKIKRGVNLYRRGLLYPQQTIPSMVNFMKNPFGMWDPKAPDENATYEELMQRYGGRRPY